MNQGSFSASFGEVFGCIFSFLLYVCSFFAPSLSSAFAFFRLLLLLFFIFLLFILSSTPFQIKPFRQNDCL